MNYRHAFHAGNICDVVKHASLTLFIEALKQKETPFGVLDTHAGTGCYSLIDSRAQKTSEAEAGIQKLWHATQGGTENATAPGLAEYLAVIKTLNSASDALTIYPGSPLLTRRLMRQQDRLVACELHPEDSTELRRLFAHDTQVQIHHRDAYEAVGALLPPADLKRGLVLMDPPFEKGNEWDNMADAIARMQKRWSHGGVMLWYPIKDRATTWRFHEKLAALGLPKILVAEFIYEPEIRTDRLNGTGLIIVNPPWKYDESLSSLYKTLHTLLETNAQETRIKFL